MAHSNEIRFHGSLEAAFCVSIFFHSGHFYPPSYISLPAALNFLTLSGLPPSLRSVANIRKRCAPQTTSVNRSSVSDGPITVMLLPAGMLTMVLSAAPILMPVVCLIKR
jgi:hypothetical protein